MQLVERRLNFGIPLNIWIVCDTWQNITIKQIIPQEFLIFGRRPEHMWSDDSAGV
jgi:hypothetical protein